jgi:tetratricopeptide (TPR) repeat protein
MHRFTCFSQATAASSRAAAAALHRTLCTSHALRSDSTGGGTTSRAPTTTTASSSSSASPSSSSSPTADTTKAGGRPLYDPAVVRGRGVAGGYTAGVSPHTSSLAAHTPPPRTSMTTPAASPGGVQYTRKRQEAAEAAELRRRMVQRATAEQRAGHEPLPRSSADGISEREKWWPEENQNWSGQMFASSFDKNKKKLDGMYVPEMKEVFSQETPLELSYEGDNFFVNADFHMADETFEETRRFVPPPSFDPAVDEIDDDGFTDSKVMFDIQAALEEDKKRLEAFGNPMTVEDQVDFLLAPQRDGQENIQQRQEFNGFVHWGLLHGAHMVLEENQETKRAHEFVNRYMRDIDLFEKWLEHPKVRAHIQKKFGIDMSAKFDKLMALTMAMYTRSKIQVYEDDPAGALKSLTACMSFITEGADLTKERHRKALGAVLVARGMIYCKLKSFERADDDLTRALSFVKANRSATLFQLRAEAREALGHIDEARADEERAAQIWETAEVITPGMDGAPRKFVT